MTKVIKLFLFFVLLGSVRLFAQMPPLIDRELFFGDPEIAGAQISPDGNYISFLKPFNNILNIWVKGRDQKFEDAHPVTADSLRPVTGYFWSRDSKYILYVQDKGGDENYRIYAVDPSQKGGPVPASRDLTPFKGVRAFIYDVPLNNPNEIIIGLNDRDPSLHDVYRLNLSTGERSLIRQNNDNVAAWYFDLEGNIRLGLRQTEDGGTEILKVNGDKLEQIYKVSNEESAGPDRFTKDGKSFYMETNKGNLDKTELVLFDLATGKTKLIDKDPLNEVDIDGALFSDKTNEILATFYTGAKRRVYPKQAAFAADYKKLEEALPGGDIFIKSMTADENLWLVGVTKDVDPGSTYLFDRRTGKAEFVYKGRPQLNSDDLATMQPVTYTSKDGLKIPAYLTVPKGVPAKNLPALLFVHGGPWGRDYWGYNPIVQFLANRGYAVLQPNFRGSAGYGKKFLNAGNKEWGTGAMQQDVTDGVAYLLKNGISTPHKIGIVGGSYGGYATLAGLAFTPDLYAAGFDIVGPSNIITLLKSFPPYWAPLKKIFDVRVGSLDNPEDMKRLEEQSPLFSAKNIKAPLFVVQGANDPRVNKAESDQIVVALRDLGREVEYMVAPDEGHGFKGKENRLAMFAAMEKFFANHLGGRYQEDMPADIQQKYNNLMVDVATVTLPEKKEMNETAELLTKFDGAKVSPGQYSYSVKINVQGQNIEMNLKREIVKMQVDGKDIWRVADIATGMLGGYDSLDIDASTLLPINRAAKQGQATVNIKFGPDAAAGKIIAGPQQIPLNIKYDSPALSDGASVDLAICSLPLKEGYKAAFNQIDMMKGIAKKMLLEVTGSEKVTAGGKDYDTFKVKVAPAEGGEQTLMWIDKSGAKVVKSHTDLGAQAGGGTVEVELVD